MRHLRNFNGTIYFATDDAYEAEDGDFKAKRVAVLHKDGETSVSFRSTEQIVLHGYRFINEADAAVWVQTGRLSKEQQ